MNLAQKYHREWTPINMSGCVLYLPFWRYGANVPQIWDISGQQNHGIITGAVPATYPMLSGKELVSNGGMETGDPPTGWGQMDGSETTSQTAAQAHSGTKSLQVQLNAAGHYGGCAQTISGLVIGKKYKFSTWVRGNNLASQSFIFDAFGISDYTMIGFSNGAWVYLEFIGTATAISHSLRIYVYNTNIANANAIFYVDDVSVQEVTGHEGLGWYVDGVGNLITISNFAVSDIFTDLIWVRSSYNNLGGGMALISGSGDPSLLWQFNINDLSTIVFFPNTTGGSTNWTSLPINPDQWVCLGLTHNYTTNTAELFLNGVSQTSKNIAGANPGTVNITLGAYSGVRLLKGQIDEVLIFNRALNAQEIKNYHGMTRHVYGV